MKLKDVFAVINQMQADHVIGLYAVGGAVAATFYLEPVATLDVDIFVAFRPEPGSRLFSTKAIFDYLVQRGCRTDGEYVIVAGWPVQFLPPTSPLVEQAMNEAREFDVEGASVRVLCAEHLAAIALETGRGKDYARLVQFVESGALDAARFEQILLQFNLHDKWSAFKDRFSGDRP